MGSLVRAQTRSLFAIIKTIAALALVSSAYVLLGPVAAVVAAVPIVAFVLRRAVLGSRVRS